MVDGPVEGHDLIASGDHEPDPNSPIFEAWQLVAAWAALTERVLLGVMVSGIMLRHPALLAKMAVTLDHVSGGRAMCGLGAGWFGREAEMYGMAWPNRDERLTRLHEAARIARSLFDEPRTTFRGQHYQLTGAVAEPKPIPAAPAASDRWGRRAPHDADRGRACRHLERP